MCAQSVASMFAERGASADIMPSFAIRTSSFAGSIFQSKPRQFGNIVSGVYTPVLAKRVG